MKLYGKGRKREQASARSITSAIAVIDLVKWLEIMSILQKGKILPILRIYFGTKERKEFPHY